MKDRSDGRGPWFRVASSAFGFVAAVSLAGVAAWGADEVPGLDIERSVVVSWPGSSTTTQIVVRADAPSGPWVPCLEPAFARWSRMAMAVPVLGSEQYFDLRSGVQRIYDCAEGSAPWDNPNNAFWELGRFAITPTNGAVRITGARGTVDRGIVWPPSLVEGDTTADFATSVDILSWGTMADAWVGLLGRSYAGGEDKLYWGEIHFVNSAVRELMIMGHFGVLPSPPPLATVACRADPLVAHRLVFTGVGSRLTLELYRLDSLARPIASLTATDSRLKEGYAGGVWLNANFGASDFDVTLDNFVMSGTRP